MEQAKILVIDDEDVVRSLLNDTLSEKGYSVVTVGDGEEGYQEAMTNNYDLIIIDFMLPGDDGIKIIEHIKKNEPDAVIILITGCNVVENIQNAVHAGVFDYLPKPFDLDQMHFSVERAIAAHNLLKTNKRLLKELSQKNVDLEEQVQERTGRLKRAYEKLESVYIGIISSLVSAIEAKDSYTHSHSVNVAKFSLSIAKEMELPEQEIQSINRAAHLHDIGKIGIRDEILHKPTKLTDEEFAEIKKHPKTAVDILKPLNFFRHSVNLIKQHHERFDGKGYPDGLEGEDILLGARIMAVADTYDAMISRRPYRKKIFTKQEIVDEIVKNSGSQFDPVVVKSFLNVVDTW